MSLPAANPSLAKQTSVHPEDYTEEELKSLFTSSPLLLRRQSTVEKAIQEYSDEAAKVIEETKAKSKLNDNQIEIQKQQLNNAMTKSLNGCIFIGHIATDLDSIASSIACADLFQGFARRASDINTETEFALNYWGIEVSPPMENEKKQNENDKLNENENNKLKHKDKNNNNENDKHKEKEKENTKTKIEEKDNKTHDNNCNNDNDKDKFICLVDHNQSSQVSKAVDLSKLRGIIDHHALQSGTVITSSPIYVDIRPWGSACSIVAHMYLSQNRPIPKHIAGILLSGVLSDTLNLMSPTTTEMDKLIVSILASYAQVIDPSSLAQQQFKAKSRSLALVSGHGLVRGDIKIFEFKYMNGTISVAFAVVETTDTTVLRTKEKREEIAMELRALKKEDKVNYAFLALVDIVELFSYLIVCSPHEQALAESAFKSKAKIESDDKQKGVGEIDLGKKVSRKKDFIPPLSDLLTTGWVPSQSDSTKSKTENKEEEEEFGEVYLDCTDHGCVVKRKPKNALKRAAQVAYASALLSSFQTGKVPHHSHAHHHHGNNTHSHSSSSHSSSTSHK